MYKTILKASDLATISTIFHYYSYYNKIIIKLYLELEYKTK